MTGDRRKPFAKLLRTVQILWAVCVIAAATALGAFIGWESHGIGGAIGLGIVGLVAGGFLSSPSFLLQLIS